MSALPTTKNTIKHTMQFSRNAALAGNKVCIMSWSLTKNEITNYRLAELSGIAYERITQPYWTGANKDILETNLKCYQAELEMVGGEESIRTYMNIDILAEVMVSLTQYDIIVVI